MSGRKIAFGVILILLGMFFLGRTMSIFLFGFVDLVRFILPFALVGIGIWLIVRKRRQTFEGCDIHVHVDSDGSSRTTTRAFSSEDPGRFADRQADAAASGFVGDAGPRVSEAPRTETPGKLKYSKLLGDMLINLNGRSLVSVEMSSGIGDVEVRLHGAQLGPGLNRMVISGFIGDIRVFVPMDMPFFASCSNFIGDLELTDRRTSGFGNNIDFQTDDYSSAECKLYIAAHNFIGDIKVHKV
jgi:hypothetical protein